MFDLTKDFDSMDKNEVFIEVDNYLTQQGFNYTNKDSERPWGGFFVIDENQADKFINTYFPTLSKEALAIAGKLSPKILIVAPNKRLSWQYHHRRAEIWKLISGEAAVIKSDSDEEQPEEKLILNEAIELAQGERHRLIGLNNWGIIAEIWRHTKADHPSDEDDIVRVQDDFGR